MSADQQERALHDRSFLKVVQAGSALCVGGMAAFLAALKQVNPEIQFEFGWTAIAGFAAGFSATLAAWRWGMIGQRSTEAGVRRKASIKTKLLLLVTVVALVFVFANPLKTLSSEKQHDMLVGTSIAVAVLSVVGVMFWKLVRFLDSEEDQDRPDQR